MTGEKGRGDKAPGENPKKVRGTLQGLDWHRLGLELSVHTTLLFKYMPIFLSPVVRFIVELFVFPQKIQDLVDRLGTDLPVLPPTSPLQRALTALGQMKGLIEGALEDIKQAGEGESDRFRDAKQKICDAFDKANDTEIFPPLPGPPPAPPPPIQREDLDSIHSELSFMKQFITLFVDSLPG